MAGARLLMALGRLGAKALGKASDKLEEKGVYETIGKGVSQTVKTSVKLSKIAAKEGKDAIFIHEHRHIIKKIKNNPNIAFEELAPEELFQWGECLVRFSDDLDELKTAFKIFVNVGKKGHKKAQEEAIKLKNRLELFYDLETEQPSDSPKEEQCLNELEINEETEPKEKKKSKSENDASNSINNNKNKQTKVKNRTGQKKKLKRLVKE